MVQVYADEKLVYDSRLEEYALTALKTTTGVKIGGTAEITMPPNHPAYNDFVSYKTIVTIYQSNTLLFRGRSLYPADDFYGQRTITCEGERCFLRDGVHRAYLYQDTPEAIFRTVIGIYNAQVEAFKQFAIGTVTVTDTNDYVRLESESAEQISDVVDKLVERCGGYIVFTTNTEGKRTINWYAELAYHSNQAIEFGENMLDFSRTGANTDMATRIIPFGAKDDETGERVTIESVNDGVDYVQDDEAVALRGIIAKAVYWDDVTIAQNLLTKAQQYLETSKLMITSLQLSAVDLSLMDKNIEIMRVGDNIRVKSEPHHIDEDFLLTERTIDLLNPANSAITLGKETATLTSADVSGDKHNESNLHKVERETRAEYMTNTAAAIQETKEVLSSLIQQTSEALRLEVSETYATNDQIQEALSTSMTQLADQFEFLFTQLKTTVDENDAESREQFEIIKSYIRFENGNIILGKAGNEIVLHIENDRISFLDSGAEAAYFSNKKLTVLDGNFLNSLTIGKFAFLPRKNGNLSLVRVGD